MNVLSARYGSCFGVTGVPQYLGSSILEVVVELVWEFLTDLMCV